VPPARPAAGPSELPGRAVSAIGRSFPGSAGVLRVIPARHFAGYLTVYLTVLLVCPFPGLTVAVTRFSGSPGKGLTS
jgi:hypothetical protein